MKVPRDPHNPRFDDTFNVSFGRWLTSNAVDRSDWYRRRQAANRTRYRERMTRIRSRQTRWQQSEQRAARPVRAPQPRRTLLGALEGAVMTLEMVYLLAALVPILLVCGFGLWVVYLFVT